MGDTIAIAERQAGLSSIRSRQPAEHVIE